MADDAEVDRFVVDLDREQALDHRDEAIDAAVDVVANGAGSIYHRPVDAGGCVIAREWGNSGAVTRPVKRDEQTAESTRASECRSESGRFNNRVVERVAETVHVNHEIGIA